MKLYNQKDLQLLLKKTKKSFIFFVVFLSLTIISIGAFVIFATYEKKALFEIIGSVCSLVLALLTIYYIDRTSYFKRLATEYINIFNEKGQEINAVVKEVNQRTITLSDKSVVYEITYIDRKKERILYLSSLFENDIKKDKQYRFISAFNYIKEYYEED